MNPLELVILGFAAFTAVMFAWNLAQFHRTEQPASGRPPQRVSVLIPARNEADSIEACINSIRASTGVDIELIVLDDNSEDATRQLVAAIADSDPRASVVPGEDVPAGWCGKQFACHQLAQHASHDWLLFVDADVHVSPDAIRRAVQYAADRQVDLMSGFPRQQTRTLGEALLVQNIYTVLLTYLPFSIMRSTDSPSASAGCGQFFLTTRRAYEISGGHAEIRQSLHDGVKLPRVYRSNGLRTDVFDGCDTLTCRMYDGFKDAWSGFIKNAHEGIANERLILPFTILMFFGYVAPAILLALSLVQADRWQSLILPCLAFALSAIPPLLMTIRLRQSRLAALLFPLAVSLFLTLQWTALFRYRLGVRQTWRGRSYSFPSPTVK